MLVHVASPDRLGRIGGWGWALGYLGAIICLLIALLILSRPRHPLRAGQGGSGAYPGNCVIGSSLVRDLLHSSAEIRAGRQTAIRRYCRCRPRWTKSLWETLRSLRDYRDIWIFLIARMLYADGLATLFQFGGLYAAGTFGMSFAEIIQFGIALNVTAGLGAFGFAWVDDRIGAKPTCNFTRWSDRFRVCGFAGRGCYLVLGLCSGSRYFRRPVPVREPDSAHAHGASQKTHTAIRSLRIVWKSDKLPRPCRRSDGPRLPSIVNVRAWRRSLVSGSSALLCLHSSGPYLRAHLLPEDINRDGITAALDMPERPAVARRRPLHCCAYRMDRTLGAV